MFTTDSIPVCEFQNVLTIPELKNRRKLNDSDFNRQIEEKDIFEIAGYFDNVDDCLDSLGLKPGQKTDVQDIAHHKGTQTAMDKALKLWMQPNPYNATFGALVEILLKREKGVCADKVACFLCRIKKRF